MKNLRVHILHIPGTMEIPGRPVYARFSGGGMAELHYEEGRPSEVATVSPYGSVAETFKYLCTLEGDRFSLHSTGLTVNSTAVQQVTRIDLPTVYHVYWRQK